MSLTSLQIVKKVYSLRNEQIPQLNHITWVKNVASCRDSLHHRAF